MDEHDGVAHGAALFERVAEFHVVIVFQAHAAEDDDVNLRLHGDAGEQLVVRLTGDGEDRELLALHQRVEHVDHRDTRADHLVRQGTFAGIKGRAADRNHVFRQRRTVVSRHARTVKDAPEQVIREGHHHGTSEEAYLVRRADALRTREDLE